MSHCNWYKCLIPKDVNHLVIKFLRDNLHIEEGWVLQANGILLPKGVHSECKFPLLANVSV